MVRYKQCCRMRRRSPPAPTLGLCPHSAPPLKGEEVTASPHRLVSVLPPSQGSLIPRSCWILEVSRDKPGVLLSEAGVGKRWAVTPLQDVGPAGAAFSSGRHSLEVLDLEIWFRSLY